MNRVNSQLRPALLSILAACLASCSAMQSAGLPASSAHGANSASESSFSMSASSAHFVVGHVYVASPNKHKIFEFPLVKGVAAPTADRILNISLPSHSYFLGQIAIDPHGNLGAVVWSIKSGSQLQTYAPGATGSALPVSVLRLPGIAYALAYDGQSNIYVNIQGLTVYAPGSTGSATPLASYPQLPPLDTIAMSGTSLYAVTSRLMISGYATALTAPTLVRSYCLPPNSNVNMSNIFVDGSRLFASQRTVKLSQNRVAIYPLGKSRCPAKVGSSIVVRPTANGDFYPFGVAVWGNSLFVGDVANQAVYQVSALRGYQPPISTMKGSFRDPMYLAVGP